MESSQKRNKNNVSMCMQEVCRMSSAG